MKQWYVAQVYAGYEETVKSDLEKQIAKRGLQEDFGEILVPSAKMKVFFQDQETTDEQLFPGYVLIEMDAKPETIQLVGSSLRVLKFLGGKVPNFLFGNKPFGPRIFANLPTTPIKSGVATA
jgi:transcriptional antiterminator NusG